MNLIDLLAEVYLWFLNIWHLELYRSGDNAVQLNQFIIATVFAFLGFFMAKRLSQFAMKRLARVSDFDLNTAHLLEKIIYYTCVVFITLIALPIVGIPVTIFTVMGSVLAIGIGFGAQNLINNLISGFIIMSERPIRIGDIVEVSGETGQIMEIGNRCVRVRRSDGVDLLMPNSFFLEQTVVNWTLSDHDIRGKIRIGVAYGSPAEEVRRLLKEVAKGHPKVDQNKEIIVIFHDFGDNALVFDLHFWSKVNRPMDMQRVESDIRYKINELFNEHEIVIAFPQRDIHLDTLSPLEIKLKS